MEIIEIFMVISIILLIIIVGVCVSVEMSKPFKMCKNKPDNYTIEIQAKNFTCGFINNINLSRNDLNSVKRK